MCFICVTEITVYIYLMHFLIVCVCVCVYVYVYVCVSVFFIKIVKALAQVLYFHSNNN